MCHYLENQYKKGGRQVRLGLAFKSWGKKSELFLEYNFTIGKRESGLGELHCPTDVAYDVLNDDRFERSCIHCQIRLKTKSFWWIQGYIWVTYDP